MEARKLSVVICCALGIAGCTGEIRSRAWSPEKLRQALTSEKGIQGVFGYYNRPIIEITELTQLVDKDGKFVSTNCNHIRVQRATSIVDYNYPIQIWYEPGLLEANKFGVQLSNSTFTAISSESTPDQGKTLANVADSFAKIAGAVPAVPPVPAGSPDCNGAPTFVQYQPLPQIQ
jgi:hypothetical protein